MRKQHFTLLARMDFLDRLQATLLGTALGDALGVPVEGISAKGIARHFGRIDRFRLLGSRGFVSDDTEQSALVAMSLARHPRDVGACVNAFRRSLLGWFLRLPWGLGLATLRACMRILLGFKRSGVHSAGNGAAMRSAIAGVFFRDAPDERERFVTALSLVTHTDERAVQGARVVAAIAAACACSTPGAEPITAVTKALAKLEVPAVRTVIEKAIALAQSEITVAQAAQRIGVTGFVMHTVPFAVFCFVRFGANTFSLLTETISAGGDTDSIGAIVGAWAGALHGTRGLPTRLVEQLQSGPFGRAHLMALADDLAHAPRHASRFSWMLAMLRNLALFPVVFAHGVRGVFLR